MSPHSRKSSNQIAAQDIYAKLRRLIFDGELKPGERVTEESLANRLKASRTPIRQALGWADSSGIVVIHPNRGASVRAYTLKDMTEVYDMWALLEGHATYLATAKVNARNLNYLKSETDAMRFVFEMTTADNTEKANHFLKHNIRYHDRILEMSGNNRLIDLAKREDNALLEMRTFQWFGEEDWRRALFFHQSIIGAMTGREAVRAQNLMREHIYTSRDVCMTHIGDREFI